ncbi:MAG: type II toxin-antitoxin system YafQ family toxin [Oscillospiraceae bacterium]|nr:type II toxin-antitoxin system YafQ family toxin [Oscillospiraceae bacterium]
MERIRFPLTTSRFRNDFRALNMNKIIISEFSIVQDLLMNKKEFPLKYKDHLLTGNYKNHRECHLRPDMLLIYRVIDTMEIDKESNKYITYVEFVRIGSHSKLFGG